MNEGTPGNWVTRNREARVGRGELTRDDLDELKRLRSETAELRMGWTVSDRTVAESMRRQRLAREIWRLCGLTRQDTQATKFPELVKRDFTAGGPNCKWVPNVIEIPPNPASCNWPRSPPVQRSAAGGGHQPTSGVGVGVLRRPR
jgi:hypothetical protein